MIGIRTGIAATPGTRGGIDSVDIKESAKPTSPEPAPLDGATPKDESRQPGSDKGSDRKKQAK